MRTKRHQSKAEKSTNEEREKERSNQSIGRKKKRGK
jgi:hypothetical protein